MDTNGEIRQLMDGEKPKRNEEEMSELEQELEKELGFRIEDIEGTWFVVTETSTIDYRPKTERRYANAQEYKLWQALLSKSQEVEEQTIRSAADQKLLAEGEKQIADLKKEVKRLDGLYSQTVLSLNELTRQMETMKEAWRIRDIEMMDAFEMGIKMKRLADADAICQKEA